MTGQLWVTGTALEAAIAHERPVQITYVAADGERTTRTIEPYEMAVTRRGNAICRAMDRRSGEPRCFRLDRIELLTVLHGGFEIARHVGVTDDLMPEILVRYHGSRGNHHGVMRLLGICGCIRCASDGVRYRLAEVGRHEAAVWCVRPTSITPLDGEDAAEAAAEDAALARIRAEIALVPEYDHRGDAAHWTPDYSR
ncbi:WYL domain-containing protein [Actinomadura sp. KC216]|uniref:WYL domain-containing protein n=1 Tax=Actinomadura sp. KC216 TaxID=2530370 RepID=UPI0010536C66|nr:WYL domain-containing protein [Actinomadura sp. KC216]TDB76795.1 WYL domain-containing protein [Actinomadura sp. KC216]